METRPHRPNLAEDQATAAMAEARALDPKEKLLDCQKDIIAGVNRVSQSIQLLVALLQSRQILSFQILLASSG